MSIVQIKHFGYGIPPGDVHKIIELASLLEDRGFDILRFGDHTLTLLGTGVEYPGAVAMVTAMGMVTKGSMVSIGVTDPYRRHPLSLAQDIATIDRLTGGRAALGFGAGEMMNLTPFGIEWTEPLTRLQEATIVIKKLWEASPENPADFQGRIYRLRNAYLQIKPVQKPHPPIYIGALGPKTRELTGELADGWYPAGENPETFRRHLRDVERGAKRAGRSLEEVDSVAIVPTAISEDREKAHKVIDWGTRLSWLTCGWRALKKYGYKISLPPDLTIQRIVPSSNVLARLNEALKVIPAKLVETTAAFGTVDDCIERIEEYLEAGATSIDIRNFGPDTKRTIDLYGEKIIPYFREQSEIPIKE